MVAAAAAVRDFLRRNPRVGVGVVAVVALALIGLGGSFLDSSSSTGPPATPSTAPPTPTPTAPTEPPGERRGPYRVLDVIDGVTLRVEDRPGSTTTVRLIGVDAPVLSDRGLQTNCLAAAATSTVESMVAGRAVRLELDRAQGERDGDGRLLAYVFVENTLVNQTLLLGGYATEYSERGPYRYQARFRGAEQSARADGIGIWSPGSCASGTS